MALDAAGHSATATVSFTVDSVRPTVQITSPMNNSALSSYSITLRWTASDVGSGIKTLEVSMNGTVWESVVPATTQFNFSAPLGIPEGSYSLQVRATDYGGLVGLATVITVVDHTKPLVSITSPSDEDTVHDSDIMVSWTMTDASSGVDDVSISIDGGAFASVGATTSREIRNLEDGDHTITVRVTDRAGNSEEVSVDFVVSSGGGAGTLVLGIGSAIVIVVAIVGLYLFMKRRGSAQQKKEPKS
jgi:hypothetical protein